MFIFDIFKRDARRLRTISLVVAGGMLLLLAGLWFVQIVSGKQLEGDMRHQSFRMVQAPAVRGRILDRNGQVLAESQPHYNVVLYLEDLRGEFAGEYTNHVLREYLNQHPGALAAKLPQSIRNECHAEANYRVVSNISYAVAAKLGQPFALERKRFLRFSTDLTYVPFQILTNLDARQAAVFAEQLAGQPGLELDTQPVRFYPRKSLAAHVIGYVQPVGEDARYLAPEYEGETGIEAAFDKLLSGQPGTNSVLVNNQGYRQSVEMVTPTQPGSDLYLTIDARIQQEAENALAGSLAGARGAAVVMDVRNGDILAMASAPAFDPNLFVSGLSGEEAARLSDPVLAPQLNRATRGGYPPGSTFKIIDSIACLESGVLNPDEEYISAGYWKSGNHIISDPAGAGVFNFERAFFRSSNTYFINYGMKAGLRKLLEVARRFHLGESTHIASRQETAGHVPSPDQIGTAIAPSSAPDVCIGQEIEVTPLQMVVMVAAIANGGTIFWPRIVSHRRSPDTGEVEELFPEGRERDHVPLNPRHLDIIRQAMLADTEHGPDPAGDGTGYEAFHRPGTSQPCLPGFRVAGKTGTAQIIAHGAVNHIVWFDSYGPYESPRYAVVVVVESGSAGSGGKTCAPVAERIYAAIVNAEKAAAAKPTSARN